jgi:hypothetical protein
MLVLLPVTLLLEADDVLQYLKRHDGIVQTRHGCNGSLACDAQRLSVSRSLIA